MAYGVYSVASLAEYEAYRARLKEDPEARMNFELAARKRFIQREDRLFLRKASDAAPESVRT